MRVGPIELASELSYLNPGVRMAARSLHRSPDSKLCEYKMKERCCPFPLSFIRSFPNFIILPSLLGGVGRDGSRDGFSYSFALFSGLSSAFRYSPNCLVPRPHCTHTTHFLPPLLFLESERESTTQTQRWEAGNKATTKLWEEGGKASVWQNVGRDGPISISIPHFILRRESAHGF